MHNLHKYTDDSKVYTKYQRFVDQHSVGDLGVQVVDGEIQGRVIQGVLDGDVGPGVQQQGHGVQVAVAAGEM